MGAGLAAGGAACVALQPRALRREERGRKEGRSRDERAVALGEVHEGAGEERQANKSAKAWPYVAGQASTAPPASAAWLRHERVEELLRFGERALDELAELAYGCAPLMK